MLTLHLQGLNVCPPAPLVLWLDVLWVGGWTRSVGASCDGASRSGPGNVLQPGKQRLTTQGLAHLPQRQMGLFDQLPEQLAHPAQSGSTGHRAVRRKRKQHRCAARKACPADKVDSTAQLTVDGKAVKRESGFFGGSASEAFWGSRAAVPAGTGCFAFSVIFGSKSARGSNLGITDRMIASFRST